MSKGCSSPSFRVDSPFFFSKMKVFIINGRCFALGLPFYARF
jgi:hypothetical protein